MKIIHNNTGSGLEVVKPLEVAQSNLKPIESNEKPLKKLIYLICMGPDKYVDMLNMCLYSLVKNGCFKGDIVVLSDFDVFDNRYGIDLNGVNLRIVNVWDYLSKYPWGLVPKTRIVRAIIGDFVDLSQYSQIMHLDIDTQINGNVNTLFEQCKDQPIYLQCDGLSVRKNYMKFSQSFRDNHQLDLSNYKGVNNCCAGIVIYNDFSILKPYGDIMEYGFNSGDLGGDQKYLVYTVANLKLIFNRIALVGFHRSSKKSDKIIAHFMGKRYGVMKEYFERNVLHIGRR